MSKRMRAALCKTLLAGILGFALTPFLPSVAAARPNSHTRPNYYAQEGFHFLWKIHKAFLKKDQVPNATVKMYANVLNFMGGPYVQSKQPAFLWTQDYMIRALYWGSRVNPRYRPLLKRALTQLDWYHTGCVGGYAYLHKNAQCLFDDNALLGGVLTQVYLHALHNKKVRSKMYSALNYVESNVNSHGGVPQRPNDPQRDVKYYMGPVVTLARSSVELASHYPNSPNAAHQVQLGISYFNQVNDPALGLYKKKTGLFIGHTKYVGPGNKWQPAKIGPLAGATTGVMKLALDLYLNTGDVSKLNYAEKLMTTVMNHGKWIKPDGGVHQYASNGGAAIVDALCDLYRIDHKEKWYNDAKKIVDFLLQHGRDQGGWFANGVPGAGSGGRWSEVRDGQAPDDTIRLLPQAAAAVAILQFAYTDRHMHKD